MPYNVPTLKQLINNGLIDIESSLDTVLAKFGVEQALNAAVSGALRDLYDYQTWIVRQIIPTTESDDQTIIDAAQYEGITRKLASYASGQVTFSGTTSIAIGQQMTTQDGASYTVTTSGTAVSGSIVVTVTADDAGVDYNLAVDSELTLVSTIAGINPTGVVTTAISGGADIETIASVLERLLFRKRNPPMGGSLADYVAWCREVSGVTRAWSIDYYQGGSTVGYAFVFDDREDIIPTSTDITNMNAYIYRHQDPSTGQYVGRPGGIEAIYINLTLKPLNPSLSITPDTAENRTAVETSMSNYIQLLGPGDTLLLNSLRTAIGTVNAITDYDLQLTANVTAEDSELHSLGTVNWVTAS